MTARPVLLTEPARQDLVDMVAWIAEGDPEAAERYLRRVQRAIQLLGDMPELGRRRDELLEGLRSMPVERHMIFYRILSDGLEVVRVVRGERDIDALF